ncbi:hypothetical protein DXB03_12375 [Lachnospiraceae bacterium OF11-28]|nr:hypothetical protein DXB03_12375 [Lachnospiraceae bacterium OF11-28]
MPKVEYVEKTIFSLEGVNVDFIKDGKNVRDDASLPKNYKIGKATKNDASLPKNYKIGKATKNSANVTFLINKLQMQFPGYDFIVYDGEGNQVRGNMLLGNVRDTYLE